MQWPVARKGATVVADTVDVTDRDRFLPWLTAFDEAHPVDLVIANAGISIDKDNSSLDDFSIIRKTLDVNINGVLNTVEPLLGRMIAAQARADRYRFVPRQLHRPALLGVLQCQQGRGPRVGREHPLRSKKRTAWASASSARAS